MSTPNGNRPNVVEQGALLKGCPACGTALPEMETQVETIHDLERQLRVLRGQLRKAVGDRDQAMTKGPDYDAAVEVCLRWQERLAPRTKEPTSPLRVGLVLARLHGGYTPQDLMEAIEGYRARPYVVDGRRVRQGPPARRHTDLELIMRDARHVDAGRRFYEQDRNHDSQLLAQGADPSLAQLCDCGHPRVHHVPPRFSINGLEPCGEQGCPCASFDDLHQRAEQFREAMRA